MPFTLAHPAAVVIFKNVKRTWLSATGLVAGSMTPDFEYFLRMRIKDEIAHTYWGLLWFDLPLGILLTYLYHNVIKDALIDHLPQALNKRFSRFKHTRIAPLYIVIISVLIGTLTHLIWDGFTHFDGYFVELIPVLSRNIILGPLRVHVYGIMQHSSTLLGFGVIAFFVYRLRSGAVTQSRHLIKYWLTALIIMVIAIIIRQISDDLSNQLGNIIVTIMSAAMLGLIGACITYKLLGKT